mmetsp:Transcript_1781/g.5311  ORF Transcript_1781/g.5311 Transcript_1781/m.5311 type:complete len:294 (-) Transcript_1781:794-1675(-)
MQRGAYVASVRTFFMVSPARGISGRPTTSKARRQRVHVTSSKTTFRIAGLKSSAGVESPGYDKASPGYDVDTHKAASDPNIVHLTIRTRSTRPPRPRLVLMCNPAAPPCGTWEESPVQGRNVSRSACATKAAVYTSAVLAALVRASSEEIALRPRVQFSMTTFETPPDISEPMETHCEAKREFRIVMSEDGLPCSRPDAPRPDLTATASSPTSTTQFSMTTSSQESTSTPSEFGAHTAFAPTVPGAEIETSLIKTFRESTRCKVQKAESLKVRPLRTTRVDCANSTSLGRPMA